MFRAAPLILVLVIFTTLVCLAQEPNTLPMEGLHFELVPYLLAPGMSGEATVQFTQQDINASAGDIFGHLQMGFMLAY